MSAKKKKKRLSREDWLREALLDLAADGIPKTIDQLVDKLGVTKGSFYHHFTDREDFIVSLANYWDEAFTRTAASAALESTDAPEEQLWTLITEIEARRLWAVDLPIRNWGLHNAEVAAAVNRVDRFRLNTLRQIFAKLGFKKEELEARTRAFVTLFSLGNSISDQMPESRRKKHLKALHEFFCRP